METLIGAAIIAVAIVIAGLVHGRQRAVSPESASGPAPSAAPAERDPTAGRSAKLDAREAELERREAHLHVREQELEQLAGQREHALEHLAGISAQEARETLLTEIENEARLHGARRIRHVEDETRLEADRRARSILATAMVRAAASHAQESTVTVINLPDEGMKGRIIGREGRNIRALEALTGVDVIIDDTPGAVVLSGFDGVRREVARLTLVKLMADGRIHPARIEEAFEQSQAEFDALIAKAGEDAVLDAGVQGLDPELTRLLGRLRFRTSYGQNMLGHGIECANLAGVLAHELGADVAVARRAALLHDIGKALSHDVEGPHALVGADCARRHDESEAVAHAIEAHHNEVEPASVEAVIVQIADALSGARPGARGESLEQYVTRLRQLERVAERHKGVEKVFAVQAGRELRVIVEPRAVGDDGAAALAHEIALAIEREVEYPGQIKVTVIRESRTSATAR